MKVVMLAAGVGRRLKSSHDIPKCLIEFNGKTLLSQHISALQGHHITELLIITGYKHELIKNEIEKVTASFNINLLFNQDYEKGSALSLLAGCNTLKMDASVLIMDADVLYHPKLIDILISSKYENLFLLDRNFEPGEEPVKLCIAQDKIIEFRKHLPKNIRFDLIGESVGFFKFSKTIFKKIHNQASKYNTELKHDSPYEDIIRDILFEHPDKFNYEDITGIPWIEIDFPEDLIKAEKILQNIQNT